MLGGRIYVAAGSAGLSVYTLGAYNTLVHRNTISLAGSGNALDVVLRTAGSDTLAYVATSDATHGVEIFKVRISGTPQRKGTCAVDDPRRLWLKDDYLYVASGDSGVTVVDVSSANSPSKSTEISGGMVKDIAAAGSYLYFTDGQVTKVYDISTPTSPTRVGFMDARGQSVALDVTNQLWMADATHLRYGAMQSVSPPEIISGSESFGWSQSLQTGDIIWEMSWRTKEWTDPDLIYVVVRDDASNGGGCLSMGSGTTLQHGDGGVTTSVTPDLLGGFRNTVRYDAGQCVQMCKYWFTGHAAINDETNAWATTTETGYKFQYCPELE